jgi:5'-methylthioadenosine phosphorylase
MPSTPGRLAIVTGSSLDPDELGFPGAPAVVEVGGTEVPVLEGEGHVVLGRHGPDRSTVPHRIDHAAHAQALAALGCDRVLSIASTGSLRRDWPVGTFVVPDDFFAPWVNVSLFDDARGHSVPGFDAAWRHEVLDAWQHGSAEPIVDGGVYVQTRGPRFETPAEIRWYARVADVVGMTQVGECIVCTEAGLRYATICCVDNLANGLDATPLSVDEFRASVARNRDRLLTALRPTIMRLLGADATDMREATR